MADIREHAVLCIKSLLKDNVENQKIVRQIQPKKIVDGAITGMG